MITSINNLNKFIFVSLFFKIKQNKTEKLFKKQNKMIIFTEKIN